MKHVRLASCASNYLSLYRFCSDKIHLKKMRIDQWAKSEHFWRIKNSIIFRFINFFSLNGNAVISLMDFIEIHQHIILSYQRNTSLMAIQPRRACECGGAREIIIRAARLARVLEWVRILILLHNRNYSVSFIDIAPRLNRCWCEKYFIYINVSILRSHSRFTFSARMWAKKALPSIPNTIWKYGRTYFDINDETHAQIPACRRMYNRFWFILM